MDYLSEFVFQEIAFEGPGGVVLNDLWNLVRKRVGPCIDDDHVKFSLWHRLCQNEGKRITFHQKVEGEWRRVTEPKTVNWQTAHSTSFAVRASVKARVHCLGMEMGFPMDNGSTQDTKKAAFRTVQLIARCRQDGVQQTRLTEHFQIDVKLMSRIVKYLSERNLVDKMAATKSSTKSEKGRGGALVYLKRLSDRRVWPTFYSGLPFYHGVTDVMRKANAINLVKRNGFQFIVDFLKKRKDRVTFTTILHEMLSHLLRDAPSLHQAPQHLRELFHKQILRFLHKHNEWCVVRKPKEGAWLELQRRAMAKPEEIVSEWGSSGEFVADEDGHLHAAQRTLEAEEFRPTVYPCYTLHQVMLRGVLESSPTGLPRYSMTNLSDSRTNERVIQDVTEKGVQGIRVFNSSLGKVQMLITHFTRPVSAEFRRSADHYAPYRDPMLFPNRAAMHSQLVAEDVRRCPRPAGAAAGSVELSSIVTQVFHLPPSKAEVARESFSATLDGKYRSPFPGVDKVTSHVAYKPTEGPLDRDMDVPEDVDDKLTMLDRVAFWGSIHAKACSAPQARPAMKSKPAVVAPPPSANGEGIDEYVNTLLERATTNQSGNINVARIQWKRNILKALRDAGGCTLLTSLRGCIPDRKLLKSVLTELMDQELVFEKSVEVTLYIDKLSFSAVALPGFDWDSPLGKCCLQTGRDMTLKRQSRPTAPSLYRPRIVLETATAELEMKSDSRYDDFDDSVFCYIFRLQALTINTFVSSELVTRERMVSYNAATQMPAKTRASYDLSLARNHVKYFYMIRNGYCTARMACVRSLHNYLLQLSSRVFTVRNLILGMPLKLFAEVNGICVDLDQLLDGKRAEVWDQPVQVAGKKLNDYLFSTAGSGAHGKDVVKAMISCLRCLVHLGVVVIPEYPDYIPTDSVLLQTEFRTESALSIKKVLTEEAVSVISARRSLDFVVETAVSSPFADYWKALMEILLDASISTEMMNVAPLGQNVRTARGWEPVQNISAQSLRLLKTFKQLNKKDHYLPSDCYSLMKAVGMHYATAVRCLLFDPLFQTSGMDLYRATGIAIRTRQAKGKQGALGTLQSIRARAACFRRRRQEARPVDTRRSRMRSEKRKLLRDDTAEMNPTKRKRKQVDDVDDSENEAPQDPQNTHSDDEGDDFAFVDGVNREEQIPNWASGYKIAQMMEAVVRYGLGTERDGTPRISEHGYLTLRASALQKVANHLNISVPKLKSRWRYICRKQEAQKLTESVTMLREYNARAGFDLNTSLREFFLEAYEPTFQEGEPLPRKYSRLVKESTLIGGKQLKPHIEETNDTPKFRTCIELLKIINICPEHSYDNEVSAELMKPFAYVPGVQSLVLHEALNRLTKLPAKNLLTQKKGSQGGRRYQLSVIAQECLVPIIFGVPTFQEALRLHKEVKSRPAFVPHPVLEGGHLAYIIDQYSAGNLSLLCGDFRADIHDPIARGRRTLPTQGFLTSFFGANPPRGQRHRGKLYFIPDGIACVNKRALLNACFQGAPPSGDAGSVDSTMQDAEEQQQEGPTSTPDWFETIDLVTADPACPAQEFGINEGRPAEEGAIPPPSFFHIWKVPPLSEVLGWDEVRLINPWKRRRGIEGGAVPAAVTLAATPAPAVPPPREEQPGFRFGPPPGSPAEEGAEQAQQPQPQLTGVDDIISAECQSGGVESLTPPASGGSGGVAAGGAGGGPPPPSGSSPGASPEESGGAGGDGDGEVAGSGAGLSAPPLSDHAAKCLAEQAWMHLNESGYSTRFNPSSHADVEFEACDAFPLYGQALLDDIDEELAEEEDEDEEEGGIAAEVPSGAAGANLTAGDSASAAEEEEEEEEEVEVVRGAQYLSRVLRREVTSENSPLHPLQEYGRGVSEEWVGRKLKAPHSPAIAHLTNTMHLINTPGVLLQFIRHPGCCMRVEALEETLVQALTCFVAITYTAVCLHGGAGASEQAILQVLRPNIAESAPGHINVDEVAVEMTTVCLSLLLASCEVVTTPDIAGSQVGSMLYFTRREGDINLFPVARLREFRAARMLTKRSQSISTMLAATLVIAALAEATTEALPCAEVRVEPVQEDVNRRGRKRRNYHLWHNDGGEDVSRPATMLLTLDGSINHAVAKSAATGVLDYVMKYPGSPLSRIQDAMPLFSSVLVMQLLTKLEEDGILRAEYYAASQAQSPTSLFSSRGMIPKEKVYFLKSGSLPKFPYTSSPVG